MKTTISSSYFFLLATVLLQISLSSAVPEVEETCKEVVPEQQYYPFCVKFLKSNPKSQGADVNALMRMAVDMTLASFQRTSERIDQLAGEPGVTKAQQTTYTMCRGSYSGGLNKLEQALPGFEKGGYVEATNYLYAALDRIQSCIDSFTKTGTMPTLLDENNEAVKAVRLVAKLMESCSKAAAS